MRLINVKSLKLEDFTMRDAASRPPYAILSHTWASDASQEVLFADMTDLDLAEKTKSVGFEKLRYTCSQAIKDGLTHAWIDTCCIDKSSSAELSEAINSMFQWYKHSAVCYVFISDAPGHLPALPPGQDPQQGTGIAESLDVETMAEETKTFAKSRWFTRGWTLQELLAPKKILFYGAGWEPIGDLDDPVLSSIVSHVTRIPLEVLQSHVDLSRVSIAKRMSWASSRRTTREEDSAYCMLGIFGVNLPLLYGEGARAFRRLQEEIARTSTDHSILAWKRPPPTMSVGSDSTFASKAADFADCAYVNRRNQNFSNVSSGPKDDHARGTYTLIKDGLSIEVRVLYDAGVWAILDCYDERDSTKYIALKLCPLNYIGMNKTSVVGVVQRATLTLKKIKPIPLKQLILANRPEHRDSTVYAKFFDERARVSKVEHEKWAFKVKEAYPPSAWNMTNMSCRPSEKQGLRRVKSGDSDNAFSEPELSTRGMIVELSRRPDSVSEEEAGPKTWNICVLFSYAEDEGTLGLFSAVYGRVHVEEQREETLETLCRLPLKYHDMDGSLWKKVQTPAVRTRKFAVASLSGDGPTVAAEILMNDASPVLAVSLVGSAPNAGLWRVSRWRLGLVKDLFGMTTKFMWPLIRFAFVNSFFRNVARVGDLADLMESQSETNGDAKLPREAGMSSPAHGALLPRDVLKKTGRGLARVEFSRTLLELSWFDIWNDLDDEETEKKKEKEKKEREAMPKSVMSGLTQISTGLSSAKVRGS